MRTTGVGCSLCAKAWSVQCVVIGHCMKIHKIFTDNRYSCAFFVVVDLFSLVSYSFIIYHAAQIRSFSYPPHEEIKMPLLSPVSSCRAMKMHVTNVHYMIRRWHMEILSLGILVWATNSFQAMPWPRFKIWYTLLAHFFHSNSKTFFDRGCAQQLTFVVHF